MDSNPSDPTVVCAWCGIVLHEGDGGRSHGICQPCAAKFLARMRNMKPGQPETQTALAEEVVLTAP